jgi:hypothetical protein
MAEEQQATANKRSGPNHLNALVMAMAQRALTYPLEVISTRRTAALPASAVSANLTRGMGFSLASGALRSFAVSESFFVARRPLAKAGAPNPDLLAGFAMGVVDVAIGAPVATIRTRLQTSCTATVGNIIGTSTLKDLYRVAPALMARDLLYMSIFNPLNETANRRYKLGATAQAATGVGCALVASAASWPLEWMRVQKSLAAAGSQATMVMLFRGAYQRNPWLLPVLFAGYPPAALRQAVIGALTALVYRELREA